MRKKILFLVTKSNWGGAQRYVYDLATNLPRDRFEATVASGGNGALFDMLAGAGVRAIPIPGLDRNIAFFKDITGFWYLLKIIRSERPDIVHLNSSKVGAIGAIAARIAAIAIRKKIRVVFTAHGWGVYEDRSLAARAAILLASILSSLFQDCIVVLDRADLSLARKFIPRRKLTLIPNGVAPTDAMRRDRARDFFAEKIARPVGDDTVLIGTVAELTKNKGLSYLIEAVRLLSRQTANYNLQIVIIGDGEDKAKLQEQIRSLRLEGTVSLIGAVPDARRYLAGLDIFVLPSLKEGLPYALMEAMQAGLPVIATRVGGIPDIINNGENGLLVDPKNARDLADAMVTLLASPEARAHRDLGARARQAIETRFPFSAMMEHTVSLYKKP